MRIKALAAENFMSLDRVELELPATGIVLVTGNNGEGKSALSEIVAYAGWGKTLRGAPPIRAKAKGFVEIIEPGDYEIRRSWDAGGKHKISSAKISAVDSALTVTKAQEQLERFIGSFDLWRRTCVFTADLLGRFTDATDAERKRFLEEMTDPDGTIEEASQRCRADLRSVEQSITSLRSSIAIREENVAGLRRAIEVAISAGPAPPANVLKLREAQEDAKTRMRDARQRSSVLQGQVSDIERALGALRAEQSHVQKHAQRLDKDECPECGQTIPETLAADAKRRAEAAKKTADEAERLAQAKLRELKDAAAHVLHEHDEARDESARLSAQISAAERDVQEATRRASSLKRLKSELAEALDGLDVLRSELATSEQNLAIFKATDKVLGTRGVRSHLLEGVLASLESETNEWLSRLCGEHDPMSIALKPYSEKVRGGTQDVISLKVDWGGGSYESASRGERRRVDVAVMLALAGIRHGASGSTLWLDEVLDSLDEAAIEAACGVFEDLARHRAIVLVSHNDALVRQVEAVEHHRVEGGKLVRVR